MELGHCVQEKASLSISSTFETQGQNEPNALVSESSRDEPSVPLISNEESALVEAKENSLKHLDTEGKTTKSTNGTSSTDPESPCPYGDVQNNGSNSSFQHVLKEEEHVQNLCLNRSGCGASRSRVTLNSVPTISIPLVRADAEGNGINSIKIRCSNVSDVEDDANNPHKRPRRDGNVAKMMEDGSDSVNSFSGSEENEGADTDSDPEHSFQYQPSINAKLDPPVLGKKRARKLRSESVGESPSKIIKRQNPFKRPPIHILKRTGEGFLQDGSCLEVAPKLGKCRECRLRGSNAKKGMSILCRFYGFRKLRYTRNGSLACAGFSNPLSDPTPEDIDLWLPSKDVLPKALELEMAIFLVNQLGDQFCELVQQEKEAIEISESQEKDLIAWKKAVQGVREMCDACDTTLFNFHWACKKCGFVVCISCYRVRKQRALRINTQLGKDRDEFQWLLCTATRQAHEIDGLMLTQSVAGQALTYLGDMLHTLRLVWDIPQECDCAESKKLKALKQAFKLKETTAPNLSTEAADTDQQFQKCSTISVENKLPTLPNAHKEDQCSDAFGNDDDDDDDEGSLALFEILSANSSTEPLDLCGDKKYGDDAGITSTPSAVFDTDFKYFSSQRQQLKHFIRRKDGGIRREKDLPDVKSYCLSQTAKQFPDVSHSWLCLGKLLHLHDPLHPGNLKLFQEVWKRGQPVIVSHVSDRLNKHLWSPDSFLTDFAELKNDLINCMTGRVLAHQPMKKFWEGFEYVNKRLKDEKGNPMLLKLKDWPPGEDFAESLPSRFKDLMACLPLPDYTNRTGHLNLASRLPDNFVRPDLGPKMYIAYGSGTHLDKGTTNLHLDISDAVNLMVYVGIPKDVDNEEDHKAVLEALEESDVDGATVDRVKEDGDLPGALWHIYHARDADKIRDLLNEVALERGVALEPHHDPIHDQSWYLDKALRQRLVEKYNVMGYPIVQFMGDAVFIPAGAPHQVRNLHNCIKIAEDFVSPENVSHCFHLTEEFRNLTYSHTNHEDKLQIKNIIYHAVKDAVSVLQHNLSDEAAALQLALTANESALTSVSTTSRHELVQHCNDIMQPA